MFKFSSFPVTIPSNENHVTQIIGLPFAIVVHPEYDYFITLKSEIDLENSPFISLSTIEETFATREKPNCALALWKNDDRAVMKLCQFEIRSKLLDPSVKVINETYLLLNNIKTLTYKCLNGTWSVGGCELCLFKHPCMCAIHADNFFITPRLQHCVNMTNSDDKISPINMAVLSNFFSSEDLRGLTGNSLVKEIAEIELPKFEIYRHSQEAALAADREARYDLQRVSEMTKNQTTIYHGLADVLADTLSVGEVSAGRPSSFLSWILDWETWIIGAIAVLSVMSFIIALSGLCKIRALTAAVLIAKSTGVSADETGQSPLRLNYFATTTTAAVRTDTQNITALFNFGRNNCASYSAVEIAILTLLIIAAVLIVGYVWNRKRQRNYFFFCIELGNETNFERLKCIKLTGSENLYMFFASSFIKSITIKWGIRPKVVIVWPTFCIKHTTLNNIYSFNGKVTVSWPMAYRIHKMIRNKSSFYALPLVGRVGKYHEVTLISDQATATSSRNVVGPETEIQSNEITKPENVKDVVTPPSAPLMAVSMLSLSSMADDVSNMPRDMVV